MTLCRTRSFPSTRANRRSAVALYERVRLCAQRAGRGHRGPGGALRPTPDRGLPDRHPAGPRQPLHRPLAGDGHGRPAAVPDLPGPAQPAAVRLHRRHVSGRDCAGAPAGRPRGRPQGAPQGGRRHGLRRVGAVQARPRRGGWSVARDDRRAARRPPRQGHPHRSARRPDLARQRARRPGPVLRRAPRARHGRRDARPARRVRPSGQAPGPVRTPSSWSPSRSPSSGSGSSSSSSRTAATASPSSTSRPRPRST